MGVSKHTLGKITIGKDRSVARPASAWVQLASVLNSRKRSLSTGGFTQSCTGADHLPVLCSFRYFDVHHLSGTPVLIQENAALSYFTIQCIVLQ